MQAIAAEFGFSETVFLSPANEAAHSAAVRIFTPANELPFAGHPLVGAGWWLRRAGRPVGTFLTGVGPIGVAYESDRVVIEVPLVQPVAPGVAPPGIEGVVDVAVVAMPVPYLVVELDSVAALESLAPTDGWEQVYCVAAVDEGTVRARFFAMELGVAEDPATGSAAVALAARRRAAGEPSGAVTVLQGEEMGQPSRIDLAWGHGIARVGGTSAGESPLVLPG